MKFWVLLILGAVSPYLFNATLPTPVARALLLLTALLVFAIPHRFKVFCLFPAFFLSTTFALNERITQRFPHSETRSKYEVQGVIGSLPNRRDDVISFVFLPDNAKAPVPAKIQVYWFKDRPRAGQVSSDVPKLGAGERWLLQLELRSPRARVNFHGVDTERWFFTQGIDALAYVKEGKNIRLEASAWFDLQHWRELVLEKISNISGELPAFRMLAALAIADRRGLEASDRRILSATGTGHLLAISGLHIGLAATIGFYLGRLVLLLSPIVVKLRLAIVLPWLLAWLAALSYAGLSGFGISTQRALIMLSVATVVLLNRRYVHPFLAWLIAMALVLITDPFAPLRAGFWFSFVAVAILMMLFVPRHGPMPVWRRVLFAQLGISLVMAPLGMYWFQQSSLPGLLANLVAIPVVSLFIVPLILMALLFVWLPGPLAGWLLTVAGYLADELFNFLELLSGLQPVAFTATRSPGFAVTIVAMLGAVIVLLPRGSPARFTGLLLMVPLLIPATPTLGRMETQIDFLDVGQGLAVLLNSRDNLVVYDTGPGNGLSGEERRDTVSGTILPMIRATALSPDIIIASHGDLDHAGGLEHLQSKYPSALYLASLPAKRKGIYDCVSPTAWMAGNLEYRVLHPSPGLPYLGNDSSCVISVTGAGLSLLLSGDISRVVEQRLIDNGLAPHAVLTAPHHGSSTSSSAVFIEAVKPSLVLISAATNSRFGFPRADVIKRYAMAAVPTYNTARCGGIRITTGMNGSFKLDFARVSRKAIWRWPAAKGCISPGTKFDGI